MINGIKKGDTLVTKNGMVEILGVEINGGEQKTKVRFLDRDHDYTYIRTKGLIYSKEAFIKRLGEFKE